MAMYTPKKTRHDFHLSKTGSFYRLYVRGKDDLPSGMRWLKGVTSMILHITDNEDRWISTDDKTYTPLNDTPVRTIIRKGQSNEVIAIFTHDFVNVNDKKQVNIWSNIRGFYAGRPNAVFTQTEDYDGSHYDYWADTIANVSGRIIKTVKNLNS